MLPAMWSPRVNLLADDPHDMLCDDEKHAIAALKRIYVKTIELDSKLQREMYDLEEKTEAEHNVFYDQRKKVLDGIRQRYKGGALAKNVSNFWLRVLKASYPETISEMDSNVLCHMNDIRSKLYSRPQVKFEIYFHFEPNVYFSNKHLTKTYYLNCTVDPEEPMAYNGDEIYKAQGCTINWKSETLRNMYKDSFFKFFSPPSMPEDTEDPTFKQIKEILVNDFHFGIYLKERVIPKAVFFFTGEIKHNQGSSSDTEGNAEDDGDSNAVGDGEGNADADADADAALSDEENSSPLEEASPNQSDFDNELDEESDSSDDVDLYRDPGLLETIQDFQRPGNALGRL
ncbi:nucleosome assembly protein 1-like 1-B [Drosophila guanche]|uniref:nucleosome assembly protein 1-like 1-B n=1 Tax=Drosophila guanche TaxID=7266 RepID=UPI001471B558|nr:nucleosome assembly protein 1-like 1-B [Drosophila guanche]